MYFPVADIEVNPWLPPLVAFSISLFTSMGGVSGAFMLLPFQVSVIVGIVGGVYGIGGGAIIAPFFVSIFKLPVYTVAGAALMGTLMTSIAGVAFFQVIAPFYPDMTIAPDWHLGLLFVIGGAAGMYCGARLHRFFPPRFIKFILAFAILFTAVRYLGIL